MRPIRISAITLGTMGLFNLSADASAVRGFAEPEGMTWALAILAVVFLVRAGAAEAARSQASASYKDLLWGLCAGTGATLLLRL